MSQGQGLRVLVFRRATNGACLLSTATMLPVNALAILSMSWVVGVAKNIHGSNMATAPWGTLVTRSTLYTGGVK